MTPAERKLYDRLCKVQGSLFKLIGNIESQKGILSGHSGEWYCSHCQTYFPKKQEDGNRCILCGESKLIQVPS